MIEAELMGFLDRHARRVNNEEGKSVEREQTRAILTLCRQGRQGGGDGARPRSFSSVETIKNQHTERRLVVDEENEKASGWAPQQNVSNPPEPVESFKGVAPGYSGPLRLTCLAREHLRVYDPWSVALFDDASYGSSDADGDDDYITFRLLDKLRSRFGRGCWCSELVSRVETCGRLLTIR